MQRLALVRSRRTIVGLVVILVLLLGGVTWLEQTSFLAWYCVRGLTAAADKDRDVWVQRLGRLDRGSLPSLVEALRRDDPRSCAAVGDALGRLTDRWGRADARSRELAGRLAERFELLSKPGQEMALRWLAGWSEAARGELSGDVVMSPVQQVLGKAARVADGRVHGQALTLVTHVLAVSSAAAARDVCQELVRACLRDDDPELRIGAARLSPRLGVEVMRDVVLLLDDRTPGVRRAALLVVAPLEDILATDDLLRWLHDPDPEVRQLCEQALRGRGLQENHLRLARLMTNPQAATRLQVLDLVRRADDLEPGVWLRRLSHDASPAVRGAAVRAAAEASETDLTDRIEQMSQNDPSPTVRQIAQYYLAFRKSNPPSTATRTKDSVPEVALVPE